MDRQTDGQTDVNRELTFHDTQNAVLLLSVSHVLLSYVSLYFVSPGNPRTIQYLIPGRTTKVELLIPVKT